MKPQTPHPSFKEFVLLMSLMTAAAALAIDAVMPALSTIGTALQVQTDNDRQLIISLLFAGMALGQLLYGPLSDSFGRKPAIYVGFGLYIAGSLIALLSPNLSVMLFGRFLQGLGAAGPRIVSVALIRDLYEGRMMARVMSFVMSIFIFVPAVAPALGEGLLYLWGWQAIFGLFIAVAAVTLVWFILRQPETLPKARRIPLSLSNVLTGIVETCRNRTALGYTVAMGLVFSVFMGYLSSAEQIFRDTYGTGELFALYFGIFALSIGLASYLNARLVMRYGMRPLSSSALAALTLVSLLYFTYAYAHDGVPPFWSFMLYGLITFFCFGLLFGNLNAMAMEPLGHIAGIGAAVVGSLSTFIALPIGVTIGRLYDGGILALVGGFALLGAAGLAVVRRTGHEKMQRVPVPADD
ncbi:multidrug effflux MFS transporter [Sulfurimonas sp. HSL1-2]|uniref:multidrug effflux MFS transporter n=1 Tax=Thiomicrolovo zhangzhouensis TaxID=3131933 RepID=UPI0031F95AE4